MNSRDLRGPLQLGTTLACNVVNPTLPMKTNSLLLIASFAAFALSAKAASNPIESELVVLPKYTVTAPRYQPVEKQINASLNELRRQAQTPLTVTPEFAALKAKVIQNTGLVRNGQESKNNRIAKL